MPFKRILSAVDFSPDSVEGFRIAVEMSSVPSASLHLLHVIEARPTVPVDAASEIVEEANAAIDRLVSYSNASRIASLTAVMPGPVGYAGSNDDALLLL